MEQGTQEWRDERCGRFTASRMADLLATTKSGPSASRKNYIAELVIERLTGEPQDNGFVSKDMQRGIELEPEARTTYEFEMDAEVSEVGFVVHPELDYTGASPDGLVSSDGAVEIKCPRSATHIETVRTRKVPNQYFSQMQWVMACTGRLWCDYVSYDPRIKDPRLTLCVIRVNRDDAWIEQATAMVRSAETEVRAIVEDLKRIAEERHVKAG